tara:strand:- start:558 stop:1466 length:909 start_codon:yes stop_codon:yes gene_type:complete
MSKLETNTIDTISGSTTLTLGGTNATTIAQDSATTVTGFKSTGIDDNASSTAITIDSSENVGIGTTSPTRLLTVENSSGNSNLCVKSANSGVSQVMFGDSDSDVIGNIAYNHTNNYMYTEVNGSEAMRIDSGRNILMNTTSQLGSSNSRVQISNSGDTFGMAIEDDSGNTGFIQFHNSGGTAVGSIVRSGSGTNYQSSSDYRLKENIVDITDATNRVKQLQPKRFNFIADADTTVDGFIAHEVSDIVPEAIHGTKDGVDENGNPIYQGIDQAKLVPVLTKALQEAITKIEELETRIQTLENA